MAHTIDLSRWYKRPSRPTLRGSDPLGQSIGLQTVTLNTEAINPDIPLALPSDVIEYSVTSSQGNTISIDTYGHISTTSAPVAGDSFTYTILRIGTLETFTWS